MVSTVRWSRTDTTRQNPIKAHGVHYTPPDLAEFLARHLLAFLPNDPEILILDPACGDGELLEAVANVTPSEQLSRLTLLGVDRDPEAIAAARVRLADPAPVSIELRQADFLAVRRVNGPRQATLFDAPMSLAVTEQVTGIISNPPYVRTQVLGSDEAQRLATEYDLSGRVDLYHAFVQAMTDHLEDGGILALLCSNRFLTTQGGAALRKLLWREYELCEIFDLGDTKLFAAAVLPAIIIARKCTGASEQHCAFTRIYEKRDNEGADGAAVYPSVVAAVDSDAVGVVRVNEIFYELERGTLQTPGKISAPWAMTSATIADWLSTVDRHTECTFADVSSIRVGIKTTADPVFIRKEWDSLPDELQPEAELLHPLLTHHIADRWKVMPNGLARQVLYPYITVDGRRAAVNLEEYPCAKAYLNSHYERLVSRTYVIESGRQWYEIWVPQQPSEWPKPKIVFPDIAETPRFFLDTSGAIVNGDCYWLTVDGPDRAYVMLAVANSTFAVKFYDAVCANRLYAGRRRYITQYVNRFPIPRLTDMAKSEIIGTVQQLIDLPADADERLELEAAVDGMIWRSFGLAKEVAG